MNISDTWWWSHNSQGWWLVGVSCSISDFLSYLTKWYISYLEFFSSGNTLLFFLTVSLGSFVKVCGNSNILASPWALQSCLTKTIKWENPHHFLYQLEGEIDVLAHKAEPFFLTTGTPLKCQWPSALQSRSAHPSPMPSSSCRCWKARRPWWAPRAKDKPSSLPSTSWEVREHWAPSVSTCLACGCLHEQMLVLLWHLKGLIFNVKQNLTLYLTPVMPL